MTLITESSKTSKSSSPKKGRGGILDELSDYVTAMTHVFSRLGRLCSRDVKMRTDSLKGQTEDGFSVARDNHSRTSELQHTHHHRKYGLISVDLVASFR